MALSKSRELASGVVASYWKVVQVNLKVTESNCIISLALFKDQDARSAGKSWLESVEIVMGGQNEACSRSDAYGFIKGLEEFSGSEDC